MAGGQRQPKSRIQKLPMLHIPMFVFLSVRPKHEILIQDIWSNPTNEQPWNLTLLRLKYSYIASTALRDYHLTFSFWQVQWFYSMQCTCYKHVPPLHMVHCFSLCWQSIMPTTERKKSNKAHVCFTNVMWSHDPHNGHIAWTAAVFKTTSLSWLRNFS
jgi:hypothetical protein